MIDKSRFKREIIGHKRVYQEECAKEMQDINDFEVEIPELKIYYEDLEKIDISPEALMELMPYIQT